MLQHYADYRYCHECGDERPFEQFHAEDCPDMPGDCPEWACTGCGAALIIGWAAGGYISGDSKSRAA